VGFFDEYNICKNGDKSIVAKRIYAVEPDLEVRSDLSPSDFVGRVWEFNQGRRAVEAFGPLSGQASGSLAQTLLVAALVRSGVGPLLVDVAMEAVPSHCLDVVIATEKFGPITVASNSQLKERWKTENLAAYALKQTYSTAKSFVFTLDERDAKKLRARIACGEAKYLDGVLFGMSAELDDFVSWLQSIATRDPVGLGSGRRAGPA